jgi:signal peptidase I
VNKPTIHISDDPSRIPTPDTSGATRVSADENAANVVPAAPRILEIPVAGYKPSAAQTASVTSPAPPLVVQTGGAPRESTGIPPTPVAAAPVEIILNPIEPTPPSAPFIEPWLAHPVGETPTVAAPPVAAPPPGAVLEPWLTPSDGHPNTQADVPSPEKIAKPPTTDGAGKPRRRKSGKAQARPSNRRILLTALRDAFIALALLFVVLQFFAPNVVREHSMENTLEPNEILYVTKQAYWFGPPGYGDIVIFQSDIYAEDGTEKTLVKRIIGVPGDHIVIQGGTVYRNGVPLDEPYTKSGTTPGDMSEVVVPADSYFVLGDNREVSRDSRSPDVGFVGRDQLRGQVLVRIFPLDRFKVF